MSASSAQPPHGPNSVPPARGGPPAPMIRKKPPVSIFNAKKKPARKPLPAQMHTGAGQVPFSGTQASGPSQATRPLMNGTQAATQEPQDDPSTYDEYPIIVTRGEMRRGFGLHYHAFRLQTSKNRSAEPIIVNPYDESTFTRPVRLYRRSARDKPEQGDQSDAGSGVDDKTRATNELRRAEREAEREANQALIAPTGDPVKRPNKRKPQKKVEDVYYDESNPKQQARSRLRYEEARPWHLEDFDGKNKWVGSYEEPLSNTNVMFAIEEGGFRMIPIEKWYKMSRTDRVVALPQEKIDKFMERPIRPPRWFANRGDAVKAAKDEAYAVKRERMEQARRPAKRGDSDDEDTNAFVKNEDYRADVDEIDFEFNDEFQDDDEGMILMGDDDEETKEIEKKIREEMRGANLAGTGVKDEDKDWDEEEQQEKRAEEEERKKQKKIRRQLKKKEARHEYDDTDSDGQRYHSSDEEDSSDEEERERLEKERKEEERKSGEASGTSSKGTNTPTGRPEKKAALGGSLKRDAELSELSGNESSRNRKKAKLNGTGAQINGTGRLSPDAAKRIPSGYGSGSDTDTSRAGRPKLKLKNSPPGSPHDRTPNASRAGSPSGSRAQSPARPAIPFPTLEEVKAAIPKEGVSIGSLVKSFKGRLGSDQQAFIALVKQAGKQDSASKNIVPKED